MADPAWERLVRPLAERIYPLIRRPAGGADAPYILEETIEDVLADGRYQIGGDVLTAKGRARLGVGQRVHVFWRRGRRERILTHQWQRAQGGIAEEVALPIVEELLLLGPHGNEEVYFRNDQQVTALDVASVINADVVAGDTLTGPLRAIWGEADNSFMVMALAREAAGPHAGLYKPRYYVFRLGRTENEPYGATTATATHVSTVDMPVFQLDASYSHSAWTAVTGGPNLLVQHAVTFPYFHVAGAGQPLFSSIIGSQSLLTRALTVVMVSAFRVVTTPEVSLGASTYFPRIETIDRIVAVRSTAASVIWESRIPVAHRADPSPAPARTTSIVDSHFSYSAFDEWSALLDGFAVVSWDDTTPAASRVASAWFVGHCHEDGYTLPAPRPAAVLLYSQTGVFIENGAGTVETIQPWETIPIPFTSPPVSGVQERPQYVPVPPATPTRVLLSGTRITAGTAAAPTVQEAWIASYGIGMGTITPLALLTGLTMSDNPLGLRVHALRALDTALYVIDEASAAAGASWPSDAERGRFGALSIPYSFNLGQPVAEDSHLAGRGAVEDLPATLTEPDGYSGRSVFAYHAVGPTR